MEGNLKIGGELKSTNGIEYEILKKIGEGGQGEVYEVKCGNERLALKWYNPQYSIPKQLKILEKLIISGAPNEDFLWPKDILQGGKQFGYIMDLRPKEYSDLVAWMKRRVSPSFRTLCLIGFNVAKNYRSLHTKGWCYCDISFGNLFINFQNGKVLICDNDNAIPNKSVKSSVKGTPKFMAPEVFQGKAKPSTNTDLFSLAVLLFYLFNVHHPLDGKKEANIHAFDEYAHAEIYGEKPVFIWDPNNESNRPVPGYQQNAIDYWRVYPPFFKEIFIKEFTKGLWDPQIRSTEIEWQKACLRLFDNITYCSNKKCGAENFYFFDNNKKQNCWSCNQPLQTPTILKIGGESIILNSETKIFQHHARNDLNISRIIGEVSQNPNNPKIWGIKNLSDDIWTYISPLGVTFQVEKGKSIPITKNAKINFGLNIAEIQ